MPHDPRPASPPVDRDRFVAELAARRAASRKSFAALAHELDHPRSTLHGWCRGDHLPFPRDDDVFARLLQAIGVDEVDPWLETLRTLRRRSGRTNPYRGLDPFTEDDAMCFCGRDALVERLVAATDTAAATGCDTPLVVVGASGSGKTSLLRAGLLATLRERPGHLTALVTPGDDPLGQLDRALDRLRGARAATLVVDQFEEVFTLAGDDAPRAVAAAIARAQRARIQTVIAVRADFFHHVAAVPYLLQALDRRQVVVGPMTTGELTDAIVEPARQAGLRVAPDLLAHLLREFDGHAHAHGTHALPLLSHVLHRLAESTSDADLRLSDYRATGGLADALQLTADEALAELPADRRAGCRELFLQLVELRTDTTPTRRRATWDGLDRIDAGPDVRRVLDPFVRRRLLTVDQDTVTLTHEALITAWPTLREWVDGQREELLVRRRVRAAHRTWHETGEPVDGLLRGALLDEAQLLVEGPLRSSLDERELAFVEASRHEREDAAARDAAVLSRQIAAQSDLLGTSDPSLSGHVALEALAVTETVEARSAVLRSCTSPAGPRFVGPTGPSAVATAPAAGRAVAAFHADGTLEHYELRDGIPTRAGRPAPPQPHVHALALDATGRRIATVSRRGTVTVIDEGTVVELPGARFDGPAYTVVMSADGAEVVAAGSAPGIVRWRERADGWHLAGAIERSVTTMGLAVRWDDGLTAAASHDGVVALFAGDGEQLWAEGPREAHPAASTVAVSPDGRALAAGYHDGAVRIWCLDDPRAPTEQPLGSAAFATWVNGVAFSPDGRLLAAASSDGSVRLWDTTTWQERRLQLRHPSVVSGVQFLDERIVLTASEDGIVRSWDVSGAVTASDASIWSAGFDRSGSTFVAASRTMLTIDRGDGPVRERQEVPAPAELQMFSGTCAVSADGTAVVAGTRTGAVLLVDGPTGMPIGPLRGSLGPIVEGVTVVDRTVAAVDSSGRLHRWRLADRDAAASDPAGSDGAASDSAGGVVSSGTALSVADLGDGLVAVATEPGELVVVDVSQPGGIVERARFRPGEAFPTCAARRPGRAQIATGGADRAVSIWSVEDWAAPVLLARLVGPAGHVMAVDVDRRGERLAAGTTDGRIWIWTWEDDPEPRHWATIETGEAGVYAVRFSPDGRHLVSAGPNHRITWWPLDVDDAARAVRRRIGDPLSEAERRRLMPSGTDRR